MSPRILILAATILLFENVFGKFYLNFLQIFLAYFFLFIATNIVVKEGPVKGQLLDTLKTWGKVFHIEMFIYKLYNYVETANILYLTTGTVFLKCQDPVTR